MKYDLLLLLFERYFQLFILYVYNIIEKCNFNKYFLVVRK